MATIFERIRKVTVDQLSINEEKITPSSSFVDDLGADSLDLVELIMAFEDEFTNPTRRINIPDEDAEKILSVQDAMDYIRDKGVGDNEPPKSAEKTTPKPVAQTTPVRPDGQKPTHPKPHVAHPTQTKTNQGRPGQGRPGVQRPPQRQGEPQRRPPQPPKAPGGQ